jgi:hypothetical protein
MARKISALLGCVKAVASLNMVSTETFLLRKTDLSAAAISAPGVSASAEAGR